MGQLTETTRRRRAERKALGLCRTCAKSAKPNRMNCEDCAKKAVIYSCRIRNNRIAKGLCGSCNKPCSKGHTLCEQHLEMTRRRRRKPLPPAYDNWKNMKARCNNPKNRAYRYYGGRGISVCSRWQHSFKNFVADMGTKPTPKHTIERINNNGNYEPSNCRWATMKEQSRNTRRTRLITYKGVTKCVRDWEEDLHLPEGCIAARLGRGDPVNERLFRSPSTLPVNRKLTAKDINEIRERLARKELRCLIAEDYQVCAGTIDNLSRGKTYASF